MDFQIVRTLAADEWQTYVDTHPQGNIFHTPQMFEVYQRTRGHHPELWAAKQGEQILALMIPVRISLTGGLLRFLTTRSIIFGGVLCEASPRGRQSLAALLAEYKRHTGSSSLFTEIRNIFDLMELCPVLNQADFIYEEHLNYLIKLESNSENVFNRIGSRTRQHIRKSIKHGDVRIREVTDRTQVALCYQLLENAYRNAHVPLADISLFYGTFDLLAPRGMARFSLATIDDEPAAASIDLLYKDVIYGWYGGVDRKFIAHVPNEALMWDILSWGCQNNYHVYDFGGAGKPHEKYGVRDFKSKFGGDLVCFGRNIWVPNRTLLNITKQTYQFVRQFVFR